MSKYNSSLVQVVTPPQYYDWCAAVWLQGPESVPPVSVSRHCRQSAGSPVPPTAGSCSCLQPGCSGLQGTAATCSTVHTLDSSSASRGTDTQQLLSIITPYHGPCFQDLTFFYIFKITIYVYFFGRSPVFGTSISGFINLKQLKLQLSEDTGAASGSVGKVSPVHVQNIVTQPVTCNIKGKVHNNGKKGYISCDLAAGG